MFNKKTIVALLSLILIVACGGGGGSSAENPTPAPNPAPVPTPAPAPLAQLKGKVLMATTSQTNTRSSPYQPIFPTKIKRNTYTSTATSIEQAKENFRDYLCYNLIEAELASLGKDFTTILKDIDIDGDEVPDINISYENASGEKVVYKNISSNSFGWESIPTQEQIEASGYSSLAEMFAASSFLFDRYNDLEQNIDSNSDGNPDRNVTVDFKFNDIQLDPQNLIIFNIDNEDESAMINQIAEANIEQYAEISLINHDINFDGLPDINLDLDEDKVAETKIDEDGDCVFDFSIVNGVGVTVAGAVIELYEVSDSDNNGWYDSISEDPITAISDEGGNFVLEEVRTDKTYILKIVKDRGTKKVWAKEVITIQGELDVDIGAFTLSSAPILVGVKSSLDDNFDVVGAPFYGSLDVNIGRSFDFEVGKSWTIKLFFEDINMSDVYRMAPYREEGEWRGEKIYFLHPNESESGFYELEYGYELREDGCFNIILNSYSPLFNDQGNFPKSCDLEDSGGSYDGIGSWGDSHYINNSDDVWSAYNFDPMGVDVYTRISFGNNSYNPVYDYGLVINDITINDINYVWEEIQQLNNSGSWRSIELLSQDDSLNLEIKTNVEVLSTNKNLNISYHEQFKATKLENIYNRTHIGDEVVIDFNESTHPLYQYDLQGTFCMVEGEVDGACRSSDAYVLNILYKPKLTEMPATFQGFYANGMPWSEYINSNAISIGDTIEFSVSIDDPNSLENEVSWYLGANGSSSYRSGWVNENESITYQFKENDVTARFGVTIVWRNNDSVATEWVGLDAGYYEQDGNASITFQVGE